MRLLALGMAVVGLVALSAAPGHAKVLRGTVLCDADSDGQIDVGTDVPLQGVGINIDVFEGDPIGTTNTESDGSYFFNLPNNPQVTQLTLDPATLPADATIIVPAEGDHVFDTAEGIEFVKDWLVDSDACREVDLGACWFTGGGVKFDADGRGQPDHSIGGNVFPSCSPDPGNGGNWNHVAHVLGLHLLGQNIDAVRCGNVPGIEPGSESPVTPFNFIEFSGNGSLAVRGGDRVGVTFFARAEDRNEPGNEHGQAGADIDRYFIRVMDGDGNVVLLVDLDDDPETIDPVTITGGNFQLHATSCDD